MSDYKEMYLTLMRETEKAISILIDAQRKCEDMYLNTADREPVVLRPCQEEQDPHTRNDL